MKKQRSRYHPEVKLRGNKADRVTKCQALENKYGAVCDRCEVSWYGDDKPKCKTRKEIGYMWIERIKEMNAKQESNQ